MTTKPDPFPKGGKVDRALTWIETTLYALRDRWVAYRASFLYRDDLGHWPVVRRIAPDVLLMKAPYTGPRRVQGWGGALPAVLTGIALVVVFYHLVGLVLWAGTPNDWLFVAVVLAVIGGFISRPIWRRVMTKTRLVIRFDRGAISWRGPDREKRVVKPEEPRALQVIVPHRLADEERRKQNDWMNTHRGESAPAPLFQTASELVIQTGPGGRNWLTVAEFCNDGSGEIAHALREAIDFVSVKVKAELAERGKQAAASEAL